MMEGGMTLVFVETNGVLAVISFSALLHGQGYGPNAIPVAGVESRIVFDRISTSRIEVKP